MILRRGSTLGMVTCVPLDGNYGQMGITVSEAL